MHLFPITALGFLTNFPGLILFLLLGFILCLLNMIPVLLNGTLLAPPELPLGIISKVVIGWPIKKCKSPSHNILLCDMLLLIVWGKFMKLHLGCGNLYLPEAVNIDKHDLRVADVQADAVGLPIKSKSCDPVRLASYSVYP